LAGILLWQLKGVGVSRDNPALTGAGRRLLRRQVLRTLREPEAGHAGCDGAGGHQQDLVTAQPAVGDDAGQRLEAVEVNATLWRGDRGRPDLDDHAAGAAYRLAGIVHVSILIH